MGWRCLIVDDNTSFAEAASTVLRGQGVSVLGIATSGAEAAETVRELRPDVVLLDLKLGDESGFDVARVLTKTLGPAAPKLILISTHDEQEFADLLEASPAVGFIAKTDLSAEAIHRLLDDGDRRSDS
jgi:CheY-like chemotaxis protein